MLSNKIILSNKIEITQDQNIYDFISQFQLLTNKILCLINGIKLHLYDDNDDDDLPKKIKLSHKDRSNNLMTIYHFNNPDTKDSYCLFGKKYARKFLLNVTKKSENSCRFNYIKSSIINDSIKNNCMIKIIDNNEITIIDNDNIKTIFNNHKPQLLIENFID
jgi:hypothetical protein